METFDNDRLLIETTTPADLCEAGTDADQDLLMCVETYNQVSQWVLEGTSLQEIGRNALCIMHCLANGDTSLDSLFLHLETERAQRMAREGLLKIYAEIAKGKDIDTCGRKAIAVLSAIRPDHAGGRSLEELGCAAGCSKQNLSNIQARFASAMGTPRRKRLWKTASKQERAA